MLRLVSLVGLVLLVGLCYALSRNRRAVSFRLIAGGLLVQLTFGGVFLYWDTGNRWLRDLGAGVKSFLDLGQRGTEFVFGDLARASSDRNLVLLVSADGVEFESVGILGEGRAPSLLTLPDGRVLAVYQAFGDRGPHAFDEPVLRTLDSGSGRWSPPRPVAVAGIPADYRGPFDPELVNLGGDRLRLYFTLYPGRGEGLRDFASHGFPAIHSAVSEDGGATFRYEPGTRMAITNQLLAHPTVARLGDNWHLYAPAAPGQAWHATSIDGLAFGAAERIDLPLRSVNVRGTILVDGDTLRMFGTGGDNGFAAESVDGRTWRLVPTHLRGGSDPGVTKVADGTYLMARSDRPGVGFVFATQILPTLIFFSSIMGVLYYLGIMPRLVQAMARVMARVLGTSGAESLSACGNVFVGQTEAPLLVRPFLPKMTMSELHAVMTGGFATIAGGVFALYVGFGVDPGHLMVASVMAAPAGLVCSKLLWPETEVSETMGEVRLADEKNASNVVEAAAKGATDGLQLALNVGAMLIAFLGLVAVLDWMLAGIGGWMGLSELSVGWLLGWLFSPIAAVMGVPANEILTLGGLLGTKIALTELVAYSQLGGMIADETISARTALIASFALCGFANFGSVAIQIGGLGAMAPERRGDLSRLAFRSMFAGALATCMTACLAGALTEVS